jgi:ferredoxin
MPVIVNRKECVKCQICVEECPEEAIFMDDEDKAVVDPEKCNECSLCISACPSVAIRKDSEAPARHPIRIQ